MRNLWWLAALGGLAAVFILFELLGADPFITSGNLVNIFRQTAIVGCAALGMTIVIIAAGIDLSVGSVIALTTVVVAYRLDAGDPGSIAILWGLAAASLCGAVNGLVVTKLKVVPFIVTLGTLLVVRGIAKGLAGEQKIDAPASWLTNLLAAVGSDSSWMIFPPGVWMMFVLAALVALVLAYSTFGRRVFAVGSNQEAARLSGVPVNRVKLMVYTLSGLFAGIGGIMQFSRLTVGDPTVAQGLELDIIAAVVIGGGSLSGGQGNILGTLIGALIMTTIRSGCSQLGYPNWVQEIITGTIIVVAVVLDRMRHK